MPSELLRRRPDVRSAELQLAAQSALIGVSVADLYPSISLLGSVGLSATSLGGSSRALTWASGQALSGTSSTTGDSPTLCSCRMRDSSSSTSSIRMRCYGQLAKSMMQQWASQRPESRSCCSQTEWRLRSDRSTLPIFNIAKGSPTSSECSIHSECFSLDRTFWSARAEPDAEFDCAVQSDGRRLGTRAKWPVLDGDARNHEPTQRLEGCAGGPAASARRGRSAKLLRNGKTMSQECESRQDPGADSERTRAIAGTGVTPA